MAQKFGHRTEGVKICMDITAGLPVEMTNEAERLELCEFEKCSYDDASRRLTASVTTTLYRNRKGA